MNDHDAKADRHGSDTAPGDDRGSVLGDVRTYLIGFGLAAILTGASFVFAQGGFIWKPAIPVALIALAIAQMGVHLVFFLHITTGPDNLNNSLALAFGTLIVILVMSGSLWIMSHLNHNMMPMDQIMRMQR